MRKLWTPSRRKLLLGGASLIASPAILRAQVPMTGAGKGKPGGGVLTPVLTYVASGTLTYAASSTASDAAANLGNPAYKATSRRCIVVVNGTPGGAIAPSSMTIDAQTATLHASEKNSDGSNNTVAIFSAPVYNTDTVGTVTMVISSSTTVTFSYDLYITNDSQLLSTTPVTNSGQSHATSQMAASITVNTVSPGILVGVINLNGSGFTALAFSSGETLAVAGTVGGFSLVPVLSETPHTSSCTWATLNKTWAIALATWT